MAADRFDAIVVGSGAGGGAAAYALTRAGWKVLVLEKGPHYDEADFFHDELTVCRRNTFVPSALDEPNMVAHGDESPARTADGWISCCVGGGTVHMSGFFFRMRPDELRGPGGEWPIRHHELAPFYDEVERVIGVSGESEGEPPGWRRRPYPMGPLLSHPAGTLVDEAGRKLGIRVFRTPRAILSADYAGRKACAYCGFCGSYGCEVGAKSSSLSSFLAIAAATGRLTLRARCMTTEVTADRAGRVTGVVYLDETGVRQRARAHVVVVACGAVQSARLLLVSRLANGSGLLGKNLMFGTMAAGWARFPRDDPRWPAGAEKLPFIDRTVAPEGGGTILFMLPHPNPILQAERLADAGGDADAPPAWGVELQRRLLEFFHETHTIEYECFCAALPHDGSDVTLDPDVKDRFGLPVARVRAATHPDSRRASDALDSKARQILTAAGALRVGTRGGDRVYFPLQCGTARMGRKASDSVLDPTGQSHDVRNLYVADGSGFPTSGDAPFTLTIMANALRIASHVVKRG